MNPRFVHRTRVLLYYKDIACTGCESTPLYLRSIRVYISLPRILSSNLESLLDSREPSFHLFDSNQLMGQHVQLNAIVTSELSSS